MLTSGIVVTVVMLRSALSCRKPMGMNPKELNGQARQRPIVYDIIDCNTLLCAEKMTLIALSKFGDAEGKRCFPSLNQLAEYAGLSRPHVWRMLQVLREEGLISETGRTTNNVPVFDINRETVVKQGQERKKKLEERKKTRAKKGSPAQ